MTFNESPIYKQPEDSFFQNLKENLEEYKHKEDTKHFIKLQFSLRDSENKNLNEDVNNSDLIICELTEGKPTLLYSIKK